MSRTIEALAAIRSSRFDLPLTYDAGELALQVGDVVRVPLGTREMLAFIVSPPREEQRPQKGLRAVIERIAVPRAFDDTGLHLAHGFVAEQYLCTLGEALGAVGAGRRDSTHAHDVLRANGGGSQSRSATRRFHLGWCACHLGRTRRKLPGRYTDAPSGSAPRRRSRRAAPISSSVAAQRRTSARSAFRAAQDARISRPRAGAGRTQH